MTNLIKAEFLRLVSRRMVWAMFAAAVVLGALIAIGTSGSVRPLHEGDYRQARADLAQYEADKLQACEYEPGGCGDWSDLKLEDFLRQPQNYEAYLSEILTGGGVVLGLAAVMAAALIGGELRSGAISTQLTFTPRRLHVMAAKLTAATVGAAALTLAHITAGTVFGTISFLLVRGAADVTASAGLPLSMLRLLLATVFVSLLAASLTFAVGSTMVAVGIGILAVFISEVIISGFMPDVPSWLRFLPGPNLAAVVNGSYEFVSWEATPGQMVQVIGFWDAASYGAVLTTLVTVAAGIVFTRRDLVR
ncbi:ABC transporter permease subunit [Tessaracoccus sp. OS52]|uniref:ABC transporter permease subunit n=1 Tax=Tessaracoccus sp. OS52 TaxID=2886691 RepID=UPI001D103F91|nr:ABC transporter permease subunit [Tessaracoccus sp. OS52]MCC2594472.1 ABC transporter permease subunit [Tessaracoccus sp. OS52]